MKQFKYISLIILILIALSSNILGLFSLTLNSNDANFYAIIAKNIILNHDTINLTFNHHDWLDKPHLSFWIIAVFYQLFSVKITSYLLSGISFYIIGGIYTYLLAKILTNNKLIGLLGLLFYFSNLHLMLSAIDIRQEAYLLGTIMPAIYYLYRYNLYYHQKSHVANAACLLLAALFIAGAMMIKGIFVLLPIFSGIIIINFIDIWQRTPHIINFIYQIIKSIFTLKWLLLIGLTIIFITPELLTLYWQFDLHPEKLVFGAHNVSGIKFFFWDSQFGRFLGNGPINIGAGKNYTHYFYFMHTFLWAFLPWSLLGIIAIYHAIVQASKLKLIINHYKNNNSNRSSSSSSGNNQNKHSKFSNNKIASYQKKSNWNNQIINNYNSGGAKELQNANLYIYLLASLLPTFIIFSITKFQLDHYINILLPLVAILLAIWLYGITNTKTINKINTVILRLQCGLAYCLLLLLCGLVLKIFGFKYLLIAIIMLIIIILTYIILYNIGLVIKALILSVLAISSIFIFTVAINRLLYTKYDLGYQCTKYLSGKYRSNQYAFNQDSDNFSASNKFNKSANNNNQILTKYPKKIIIDYKINSLSLEFLTNFSYFRIEQLEQLKSINHVYHDPYFIIINHSNLWELQRQNVPFRIVASFYYLQANDFLPSILNNKLMRRNIHMADLITIQQS